MTFLFLSLLLSPRVAGAQGDAKVTELVPEGELKVQSDEKRQGFDGTFGVSGNLSLAHNRAIVGQVDGFSVLAGASVIAGLDYLLGPHEWINTLGIAIGFARTPVVDAFVKTVDVSGLESVYAYYFVPWLAVFGRLNFETALLPTTDVRAENTSYLITRRDGMVEADRTTRRRLADPFEPSTLNESLGAMAKILDLEPARITFRIGAGGRETFSRGVLVLEDSDMTPEVDLLEIDHVFQFGGEAALGVAGKLPEQRLAYGIDAGVLFPFVNNDALDRDILELTRIVVAAQVSFSMFEWLSLVYQFKLVRDNQLIDEIQVQNNLLLTFQYTFLERRKIEEPPPPVDPKVTEALEKASAAEERAKAAEERAKVAEEELAAERAKETPPPPPPPAETPPESPPPNP
jgi:hypothetical protein